MLFAYSRSNRAPLCTIKEKCVPDTSTDTSAPNKSALEGRLPETWRRPILLKGREGHPHHVVRVAAAAHGRRRARQPRARRRRSDVVRSLDVLGSSEAWRTLLRLFPWMCVNGWPTVANLLDNAADLRKQHLWLNSSRKEVGDSEPSGLCREANVHPRKRVRSDATAWEIDLSIRPGWDTDRS